MAEKFTALYVKHLRVPGTYGDGRNLYLQVRRSTKKGQTDAVNKSWLFRYRRFGKETWMGLGPYPEVTLKEARDLAFEARRKLVKNIDPLKEKRERQIAAHVNSQHTLTFGECAELYV